MDSTRREIRVFVSSTFHDLQPEREQLVKRVFPELRRYARERDLEFTEIDLRWGVTEQDVTFGKLVRTCLEEIDRCLPFFICILGERYGWSPSYTDIQKDPTLLHDFPWLEEAVLEEASILDIEATHGLMRSGHGDGRFVYARRQDGSEASSEWDTHKLSVLKDRIRAAGHPVKEFSSAEELGELVRQDLLGAIASLWDADAPREQRNQQLAQERRLHEGFAAARRKAYIADVHNITALNRHAESVGTPLILVADSGMGKSALIAYWSKYYKARHPEAFIISHFVGLSGTGSSSKSILRHIYAELLDRLADPALAMPRDEDLSSELSNWLARLGQPVIIAIDAVNQLDDASQSFDWLPEYLPENVRLILSAGPGEALDRLRERGYAELALHPLSIAEREALLIRYLGEYRKQLTMAQSRRVANDIKTESPLFLRTMLEELRLFGEFEQLDGRIEHYLSAKNLEELFEQVLMRMEGDYSPTVVQEILTLLWASRNGLSEREILELSGIKRAELSTFLIAMDYQLIVRDGIITLFHDYLRDAAERRYLANNDLRRAAHARLADRFWHDRLTKRGAEELLWQLKEAHDNERLRSLLLDVDFIQAFADEHHKWEYLALWRELDEKSYGLELEDVGLDLAAIESDDARQVALRICGLLYDAGKWSSAERILEPLTDKVIANEVRIQALDKLGAIYSVRGEYRKAENLLGESLALAEQKYGSQSPLIVDNLISLATLRYELRHLNRAESLFVQAAEICRASDAPRDARQIGILSSLAATYYQRGELEQALSRLQEALTASEGLNGPEHTETASILSSIGATLVAMQRVKEALPLVERAASINRKMLGPFHVNTLKALQNLGAAAYYQADFELAERTYRALLPQLIASEGLSSAEVLRTKNNLAMALGQCGQFHEAEVLLVENTRALETCFGADHSETLNGWLNLARLYFLAALPEQSRKLYEKYLPSLKEVVGEAHPSYKISQQHYEELLAQRTVEGPVTSA